MIKNNDICINCKNLKVSKVYNYKINHRKRYYCKALKLTLIESRNRFDGNKGCVLYTSGGSSECKHE